VDFALTHLATAITYVAQKNYRGASAALANAGAYMKSAADMKDDAKRKRAKP
jgi:hypothetical protein